MILKPLSGGRLAPPFGCLATQENWGPTAIAGLVDLLVRWTIVPAQKNGKSARGTIERGRMIVDGGWLVAGLLLSRSGVFSLSPQKYHSEGLCEKIIVGFGAGSTADVAGTLILPRLPKPWATVLSVENRPGGWQHVAAAAVARAASDGTPCSGDNRHVIAPALGQNSL